MISSDAWKLFWIILKGKLTFPDENSRKLRKRLRLNTWLRLHSDPTCLIAQTSLLHNTPGKTWQEGVYPNRKKRSTWQSVTRCRKTQVRHVSMHVKCQKNKINQRVLLVSHGKIPDGFPSGQKDLCKSRTSLITPRSGLSGCAGRDCLVPLTQTCKLRISHRINKSGKNFFHLPVFWAWPQHKILTTNGLRINHLKLVSRPS